jgi:hypothetical protein
MKAYSSTLGIETDWIHLGNRSLFFMSSPISFYIGLGRLAGILCRLNCLGIKCALVVATFGFVLCLITRGHTFKGMVYFRKRRVSYVP